MAIWNVVITAIIVNYDIFAYDTRTFTALMCFYCRCKIYFNRQFKLSMWNMCLSIDYDIFFHMTLGESELLTCYFV